MRHLLNIPAHLGFALDVVVAKVVGIISNMKSDNKSLGQSGERYKSQRHLEFTQKAAKAIAWDISFVTGKILWFGNGAAVYGVSPPEDFESFKRIIHPQDLREIETIIDHAMSIKSCEFEAEFRVSWPDKSVHWIFSRGQILYDEAGKALHMAGINIDISARKIAEAERDRFFDLSVDLLCIAGIDGQLKRVNPAWEKCLGFSASELTTKPWLDFVHPDDRAGTMAMVERLLSDTSEVSFENRFIGKDGGYRWLRWSASIDSDKKFCYCVARDFTDVRSTESLFKGLADSIPQLAWMADRDGSFFWFNQRWYDYTGTEFEVVAEWGWTKVHHPDHVDRVTAGFREALKSGSPFEDTFPLRKANGQWRWFLTRALPIRNEDGEILRWFGTSTDITESRTFAEDLQKAKDAAEEASRTKSAFLSSVSHELRTPLGAILGFAELLKDGRLTNGERAQFTDAILRNGHQLADLIGDVLDIGRIEAGKMDVEFLKVDPRRLIQEVVATLELKANEKKIPIRVSLEESIPDILETDPLRLRQILFNIIGNSVKFTEKGQVALSVKYIPAVVPEEIDKVSFTVEDTGKGISEENRKALFEPFMQLDSSIVRRYGGTGLGLAISRKLARLLGGDIVLNWSEPEKGSSFVITIGAGDTGGEAQLSRQDEKSPEPLPASSTLQRLKGTRILLAEDAPDSQFLVKRYLQNEGSEVEVVENGLDATHRAMQRHYGLILMDMHMPVMDGYNATRDLRRRGFKGPIIALTALTMRDEVEKTMASGCNFLLTKPLSQPQLIDTVERFTKNPKPLEIEMMI
ncbi:MAG TPA: PAS domain-containing protein [Oligoflexus sp.]|uniref:PAS domain-containing protein n=1 Tax=Oligoflexus sp. TaxID=1971216 RepID=UPI002D39279D|nr:PAS domain-containing protein [Oligoflexus sp.]HYX35422.1 PAS domain-containing protein [Oligoflexus sp.]